MPVGRIVATALLWLLLVPALALAQYQPPSQYLLINADQAFIWNEGRTSIIQLQGSVSIQTDRAKLTSDRAVIWLTPLSDTVLDHQNVEIALMGNADLEMPQVSRSGNSLFINTEVRGTVRLSAIRKSNQKMSDSDLYRDASAMRPLMNLPAEMLPTPGKWIMQRPWVFAPPPASTTMPTTQAVRPTQEGLFDIHAFRTFIASDNTMAALAWDGVTIIYSRPNGDTIQLQADRAVLFSPIASIENVSALEKLEAVEQAVTSVYLEGDIRIFLSYADKKDAEQRLRAQRVYYDLTTDRAVLTDAVVHVVEPKSQLPIIVRAQMVRQLSKGEYTADKVQLSTSSFANPSYSIYSDHAYIQEVDTGDPRLGERTVFEAKDNLFEAHGVPLFYWPWAAGALTERGMPLRSILTGSGRGVGAGVRTNWGLFETLGQPPPEDLDANYRIEYFSDRGPAFGLDSKYQGGFVTETTKQPWAFKGDFTGYYVQDQGVDRLSADRFVVPEDENRYHLFWQHQQFIPDDWQIQLRAGLVSDPTFLEEWFKDDFTNGPPHDLSAYLKRQRDTEALTLGANIQPNGFVTNSDMLQEGFEVERLPQLGYYRIGDSLADDNLTFFSANTAAGLQFEKSSASLADLGFRPGQNAGLPSLGTTGTTDDTIYRADSRQEIDYPIDAGKFRIVPYIMGRYTGYTDSPDGSGQDRLYAGGGLRLTTAFWKVDNSATNDLLDIHRVRHVIEPELNLFTSAETVDRSKVFIYDEPVDAVNDISAVQLALHQRWQTKRGGAGQWRSVDFFTFNVEGNFFANQPNDQQLNPTNFRGLFFPSLPEASIPRNGLNADALWRVSDAGAILSDAQYNLDRMTLATTSIGLAVQRDTRVSYFIGARYIGVLNSTIASFSTDYQLTAKYSVRFAQSFSLSEGHNQNTSVTLVRHFDRYFLALSFYYDAVLDESGFNVGIFPEGLRQGLSSDQVNRAMTY